MIIKQRLIRLCVCVCFFVAYAAQAKEPTVVANLDLNKYQGTWYEIARFENPFQKICKKNASAQYRLLDNGFMEVLNSCVKQNGKTKQITGLARVQPGNTNAKLEVSFFSVLGYRPGWGDYWVLYVDDNYELAVVGDRKQKYGWVLSKQKTLTQAQKNKASEVLEKNGYSSKKLLFTEQK